MITKWKQLSDRWKITCLVLLLIIIGLFAFNPFNEEEPYLGLTETEIPSTLTEHILPGATFQLIGTDKNKYYLLYNSVGQINIELDMRGKETLIQFEDDQVYSNESKLKIFELSTLPESDTIRIFLNGEETHFDNQTVI